MRDFTVLDLFILFEKNLSLDGLDIFLGTSHDAKTHPKGPQTFLETNHFSKKSSYVIIIYDDHI